MQVSPTAWTREALRTPRVQVRLAEKLSQAPTFIRLVPLVPLVPLLCLHSRRVVLRRRFVRRGVRCRCADARSKAVVNESTEEAIIRLSHEISEAIAAEDAPKAQQAQRELRQIQLDKPSVACRHRIREDCISASALLRLGERASIRARVNAVKKLGRWLRWPQAAKKDLVPVSIILEGLLHALRSVPEVAWTAQCALYHAMRCNVEEQNVKEAARGKVTRLLLESNTDFPLCLPEPTERMAKAYDAALRITMVRLFFTRLTSLTLIDPGYGESSYDLALLGDFAKRLGNSLYNLQSLKVYGFEDSAIKLILPALWIPKLRSLQIVGCSQQKQSQKAILTLINRNRSQLEELELNLWTELQASDPIWELELLPKVKRLGLRVPLLPAWQHFGDLCPSLEELTFIYDQDVALNAAEVLIDVDEPGDEEEILASRTSYVYRDAVCFAAQLHAVGFHELAQSCPALKVIRFVMWDNSFGFNSAQAKEHFSISWRRSEVRPFTRNAEENGSTRELLEARSKLPAHEWTEEELEEGRDVSEEEALAAAAQVMLQVIRSFDDLSLEAEMGL